VVKVCPDRLGLLLAAVGVAALARPRTPGHLGAFSLVVLLAEHVFNLKLLGHHLLFESPLCRDLVVAVLVTAVFL